MMVIRTPQDLLNLTQVLGGQKLSEFYAHVNNFLDDSRHDHDAGPLFQPEEYHVTPKRGGGWRYGRDSGEHCHPCCSLDDLKQALRALAISRWLADEDGLTVRLEAEPERDDRGWRKLMGGQISPINEVQLTFGNDNRRFRARLNDANMHWQGWRHDLIGLSAPGGAR